MTEIYLDHAATSHPKPKCVVEAVKKALESENANPGRSGYQRAVSASERMMQARENAGRIIHAGDAMQIVFTHNCTDAINLAIKGVLKPGGHAVASCFEHNSVLRVLGEMKKSGEADYTIVNAGDDGYIDPSDYKKAVRHNTQILILTHASNVTGAVQPVFEVGLIAKEKGIPCLIDGAQAAGETDIDVQKLNCGMYAFAGHKGLLGPQGTGGLYIRRDLRLKTLREGGTGTSSESLLQPEEVPERYEAGTVNYPGIMGLNAGIEYVLSNKSEIQNRISLLSQALYEGLKAIRGVKIYSPDKALGPRTGVVSFNALDLNSQETAAYLDRYAFCVRSGLHCAPLAHKFLNTEKRGAVRASVGWSNTLDEINRFIERVYLLTKAQGPAV